LRTEADSADEILLILIKQNKAYEITLFSFRLSARRADNLAAIYEPIV
jgi:hypothetical protein